MKGLEKEASHECWNDNLAGLAAEGALVSAPVPSLHQYRFQTCRVAPVRRPASAVFSPPGSLQILLAPVLLDRSARPGMNPRQVGSGSMPSDALESFAVDSAWQR
jgi:hypothetical protein